MNILVVTVLVALCGSALAWPQVPVATPTGIASSQISNDGHWIIIQQAKDQDIDGKYSWKRSAQHHQESGIAAEETGDLKQVGPQEDGTASQGFNSYTAPDGTPIRVTYTADENGFIPDGAHLPVAPPIPDVIQRAVAYNEAHPEEDLSEEKLSEEDTKRV